MKKRYINLTLVLLWVSGAGAMLSAQEGNMRFDTSAWIDISTIEPGIVLDIRYATTNNFVKEQLYDCPRCFLRADVAYALRNIHRELKRQGLGIKVFDCYRPLSVQWKLWNKVPDPRYVADPRKGSMHNRGSAIDLTIVDVRGKELEMGTEYDFFGEEAYHDYKKHSKEVLDNRTLLKNMMIKHGFRHTRTEWWHYSYTKRSYNISKMEWPCNTKK
jgi:zinc D-Ala-D-Ala dipeptidase